jgi:transcriptional regulator GlxA family with amidase domain
VRTESTHRIVFLVLPHVHLLDLGGPAQAFYEAVEMGGKYSLVYCGVESRVRAAQGLLLADLAPLPSPQDVDTVIVAGIDSNYLDPSTQIPTEWLQRAVQYGARLCSICSSAYILGQAGLLNGRRCTTHWKVVRDLQRQFPSAEVVENQLFVRDGPIYTSAGVASGIDLSLALIEEDMGPIAAARVARELVVFMRRDGVSSQDSIYLDYRTHLSPGIHRVQDWLVAHPEENPTLKELGKIGNMSPRNLTRVFRRATGLTLKEFVHRLKVEVACNLLRNPGLTVQQIAERCGFKDARQLRRLWHSRFQMSPSAWRWEQMNEQSLNSSHYVDQA